MSFFRFGTLLYIIEEVKLSIEILVLYKFMLGVFFIRKDSINFHWLTLPICRDGQNHHMLMILKSKSNHLNTGDLKSKSKSF